VLAPTDLDKFKSHKDSGRQRVWGRTPKKRPPSRSRPAITTGTQLSLKAEGEAGDSRERRSGSAHPS